MRRSRILPIAAAVALLLTPAAASADERSEAKPRGVNPYLGLVPDRSKLDVAGWRRSLEAQGQRRAQQREAAHADVPAPILHDEEEQAGTYGGNDTRANAEPLPGFGSANGRNPRARILGKLSPEQVPVDVEAASKEDDGAIPLARATGVESDRPGVTFPGTIGDGPHGSEGDKKGDFDFYRIDATAGKFLTIAVAGRGLEDGAVELFDAEGVSIGGADDHDLSPDPLLSLVIPKTGTYYAAVGGSGSYLDNPFDSGSGTGVTSEGAYAVSISSAIPDVDFYSVRLQPGDVLAATVKEASRVSIYDPNGLEVQGSEQDVSAIYPPNTPLPGGGDALADHVASVGGTHYVAIEKGSEKYDVTVEVHRPALSRSREPQTLFLDFDGARLNTAIFGGPGVRTLSPFRAFLGKWGIARADEKKVAELIVETVEENLLDDVVAHSNNPGARLEVKSSLTDRDPWGEPLVSRVVVGGTVAESGIETIGIAQSIDPGNFGTEETALVLLDYLSEPKDSAYSLNHYLTAKSDRIAFVGRAIGNVVAHEAGHYLGSWHTDSINATRNVMDEGGDFAGMFGVGPDLVGGTRDDVDTDFTTDSYSTYEGFTGTEDTLNRLAFALSGSRPRH